MSETEAASLWNEIFSRLLLSPEPMDYEIAVPGTPHILEVVGGSRDTEFRVTPVSVSFDGVRQRGTPVVFNVGDGMNLTTHSGTILEWLRLESLFTTS